MQLYKNFCTPTTDENGVLIDFKLNVPEDYNFGYDVVDKMAQLAPNHIALKYTNPDKIEKTFTFGDIGRLSDKTANALKSQGIKKGDKVLVILKRNYEYWYVVPALHKLGAVVIPATNMLTIEDITYRIETANIKFAIATPDGTTAEDLIKARELKPQLEKIFVVRKDLQGTINLTNEIESASEHFTPVATKVNEPMLIYFTSGTTGYPKAVMHDHTYSLSHIITAKYWQDVEEDGLHLTVAETGWGKASWGKIYGQWLCGCGVMVYDFDNFSPHKLLRVIEKYKVTSFCAPPTVYRYFIKRDMSKYDLSALKHITTAGEALNPEVFEQVYKQTGLKLMEGFGQTESVLMLGNLVGAKSKVGSLGKPTPLYNTMIVNDNGEELPSNEVGEIVVIPKKKQYGIFMGYCGDEKLYKNVWRNGMYHTGDTAYKDEEGYYWYVGRIDDLIKTRGFRVGPFEIENVLMEHPAVMECAVIGVPDKARGQAIKATVHLAQGYEKSKETEKEIKHFVNSRVASYKHIQHLDFVDEMPKTISGKIKRTDIRNLDRNKIC
jgi:acetyl-CoA synthetase